jgi:hypothetical protein
MDRLGVTIADELVRVKAALRREQYRRCKLRRSRDEWRAKHQAVIRSPEYQLARKWVRSKRAA